MAFIDIAWPWAIKITRTSITNQSRLKMAQKERMKLKLPHKYFVIKMLFVPLYPYMDGWTRTTYCQGIRMVI